MPRQDEVGGVDTDLVDDRGARVLPPSRPM
jgi:hypothetical protein